MDGGSFFVEVLIMSSGLKTRALIDGDEIRCSRHGRRVGRVTDEGIELWCKSGGGHAVVLAYEDLQGLFCK